MAQLEGRPMLQNDRDNLELDKMQVEIQRFLAETRKLKAEENKLKKETLWYPLAVGAGMISVLSAAAGLWSKL